MKMLSRLRQIDLIEDVARLCFIGEASTEVAAEHSDRPLFEHRAELLKQTAKDIAAKIMGNDGVELFDRLQRREVLRRFNHFPPEWDEKPTAKMDAKESEDNSEVIDIYAFNREDLAKKMRQDGVDFCGLAFKDGTGLHRFRVDHKTFKYEAETYQDNEHGVCFRQRLSFKCRYLQNICGASDEIEMPEELRMNLGFIWKVSDGYQILYNPNERVRCWEEKGLFKAETFNNYTFNYVQLTDEVVEASQRDRHAVR